MKGEEINAARIRTSRSTDSIAVGKATLSPGLYEIFELGKKAAGRQVLRTHRWSSVGT